MTITQKQCSERQETQVDESRQATQNPAGCSRDWAEENDVSARVPGNPNCVVMKSHKLPPDYAAFKRLVDSFGPYPDFAKKHLKKIMPPTDGVNNNVNVNDARADADQKPKPPRVRDLSPETTATVRSEGATAAGSVDTSRQTTNGDASFATFRESNRGGGSKPQVLTPSRTSGTTSNALSGVTSRPSSKSKVQTASRNKSHGSHSSRTQKSTIRKKVCPGHSTGTPSTDRGDGRNANSNTISTNNGVVENRSAERRSATQRSGGNQELGRRSNWPSQGASAALLRDAPIREEADVSDEAVALLEEGRGGASSSKEKKIRSDRESCVSRHRLLIAVLVLIIIVVFIVLAICTRCFGAGNQTEHGGSTEQTKSTLDKKSSGGNVDVVKPKKKSLLRNDGAKPKKGKKDEEKKRREHKSFGISVRSFLKIVPHFYAFFCCLNSICSS